MDEYTSNGWTYVDQSFSVFVSSRCPSELGLSSTSSVKLEEVEEGSEPAEFMKALGPQDKKAYDCMLQGASSHSHTAEKDHEQLPLWRGEIVVCRVCFVSRSREVQLHPPTVPAECQLWGVRRGGAAVSSQGDGGSHGDALPAGEPLLRAAAGYHTHL